VLTITEIQVVGAEITTLSIICIIKLYRSKTTRIPSK